MAENRDFFTPKQVEEQVAWLRQHPPAHQGSQRYPGDSQLIEDLQRLYQSEKADARSLDQIWSRLESQGVSAPGPSQMPPHTSSQPSRPPLHASMPAAPARRRLSTRLLAIAAAVLLVVVVSGLVGGLVLSQHGPRVSNQPTVKPGQTAAPGQTATSVPTPCANRPTATAEAWSHFVSGPDVNPGQIMGTINNGPVTTLSDFHYPLNLPSQNEPAVPWFMAWSPDAHYLAVGFSAYNLGTVYPYIIDTTTHTTTPITFDTGPGFTAWSEGRSFAWADNHTLLLFGGGDTNDQGSAGPSYSYDVTTKQLTPLPGVHHAAEGMVRCSTLFYLELTPPTDFLGVRNNNSYNVYQGSALLHRYDLKTNQEIGQPVTIGPTMALQVLTTGNFFGVPAVPVWNISPDGTQLVYAQEAISVTALVTQQYMIADVDGANARSFASPLKSALDTYQMEISPNDQYVLIEAGADIISMNIDGSKYRSYGNYGASFLIVNGPVWLPDSSGFDVVNTHLQGQTTADPYVSRYLLSTPPGSDGYVPGTQVAPEAQILAGLP
jgi:hypothetical protein